MTPDPANPNPNPHPNPALLLVAHGSPSPDWRAPFERLAERLRSELDLPVGLAYMEFTGPTVAEAVDALVEQGARRIRVLPLFIAPGRHVARDIPALVREAGARHETVTLELLPSVGEDDRTFAVLREIARDRAAG